MYQQITPEEAKKIMDSKEDFVIIDVREKGEFESGHISGVILIPYTEIFDKAEEMIPDKNKQILVYCRSGRRSKIASESLAMLGYTNIKEFSCINQSPMIWRNNNPLNLYTLYDIMISSQMKSMNCLAA